MAHFGVGILIAGVVVSTAWRSERIETLQAGDTLEIAGRTLRLVGVTEGTSPTTMRNALRSSSNGPAARP